MGTHGTRATAKQMSRLCVSEMRGLRVRPSYAYKGPHVFSELWGSVGICIIRVYVSYTKNKKRK